MPRDRMVGAVQNMAIAARPQISEFSVGYHQTLANITIVAVQAAKVDVPMAAVARQRIRSPALPQLSQFWVNLLPLAKLPEARSPRTEAAAPPMATQCVVIGLKDHAARRTDSAVKRQPIAVPDVKADHAQVPQWCRLQAPLLLQPIRTQAL